VKEKSRIATGHDKKRISGHGEAVSNNRHFLGEYCVVNEQISRISREVEESIAVTRGLAACAPHILEAAGLMLSCLKDGGKVITFGNGGSAAEAQHFVAELVGRYRTERQALAAIALTVETASLTAIGNDYGFDHIFSRQLEAIAKTGDVVVAFSTSGNSPNVLRALEIARAMELTTIGVTGKSGGEMARLVHVCLHAPSDSTPRIQEAHALMVHLLCGLIEDAVVAEPFRNNSVKSAAGEVR
jgi:D-sedoheptulose 7-phosphate isomerase